VAERVLSRPSLLLPENTNTGARLISNIPAMTQGIEFIWERLE
jgi:hypothetical protein